MKVEFLETARAELHEAIAYYDSKTEGLGTAFAEEVQRALQLIVDFPRAWTPLSTRTRRCLTKRFPYGIIYQIRGETILVVCVMHLKRDPISWVDRIRTGQR